MWEETNEIRIRDLPIILKANAQKPTNQLRDHRRKPDQPVLSTYELGTGLSTEHSV